LFILLPDSGGLKSGLRETKAAASRIGIDFPSENLAHKALSTVFFSH
jgi:hypothetical protein